MVSIVTTVHFGTIRSVSINKTRRHQKSFFEIWSLSMQLHPGSIESTSGCTFVKVVQSPFLRRIIKGIVQGIIWIISHCSLLFFHQNIYFVKFSKNMIVFLNKKSIKVPSFISTLTSMS